MKKFRKNLVLIFMFIFCLTTVAQAATNASAQIASYAINAGAFSDGEINVDFTITGCGYMKRIGAEQITIYDLDYSSVIPVKTFYENDEGMSTEDDYAYGGTITHQGIIGHTYRVIVTVFAEDYAGKSDSRSKIFTFTIS